MAIKFNENKVKLWVSKVGDTNIGIRFNTDSNKKEIDEIYKMVQSLLEFKYGKGIEGEEK